VTFAGYRPDAVAHMKSFDLLVLPSWEEGIPRCLMEAMAARVPVVASDIPGNRELVQHGVTGLLVDPGRPRDLRRAILDTIESPERAKDMADRARITIERRFSARRMAAEYTSLYEQCSRSSS
jgi:glycosyltransferase involved in cell wall biosynthesis